MRNPGHSKRVDSHKNCYYLRSGSTYLCDMWSVGCIFVELCSLCEMCATTELLAISSPVLSELIQTTPFSGLFSATKGLTFLCVHLYPSPNVVICIHVF